MKPFRHPKHSQTNHSYQKFRKSHCGPQEPVLLRGQRRFSISHLAPPLVNYREPESPMAVRISLETVLRSHLQ